jgi:hypothetical protein
VLVVAIITSVAAGVQVVRSSLAGADRTTESARQLALPHRPGQLVVRYKGGITSSQRQSHAAGLHAKIKSHLAPLALDVVQVASTDEVSALASLKSNPDVMFAEPDYAVHARGLVIPNDPAFAQQWGYVQAGFTTAWGSTTGAGAPLIADIDSGVDFAHPDLAPNIAPGGYDFVNDDIDPSDDFGHGSATFSIIAEATNNGQGGAGGCWSCKVLPIKILDATGAGYTSTSAAGIVYAVDHGAKILNASYGGPTNTQVEAAAVDYANSHGALVVGAVCEGADSESTADYPSSFPGVIAVGAVGKTGQMETWSCHGPWVQIAAPSTTYSGGIQGYYPSFAGTSAATPFVTAALALMWASHPTATRDQIRAAVLSGAASCCTAGSSIGGGQLNVPGALAALAGSPTPTSTPVVSIGDVNNDGHVNVFDLSLLLSHWTLVVVSPKPVGDLNNDGLVNVFDLSMLLSHWSP